MTTADIAQVYKGTDGQFYFRILARNSEIIAQGEAYHNKQDALDVLEQHFPDATVVELDLE